MSIENVDRFYDLLEVDLKLREKALSLQTIYEEQEDVLDAFLALAAENGLPFTEQEYMTVMYRRAMSQPDQA
ncbi:MAG: Nif11-like leader peptide family natural product precursor [Lentisphaeria bacterium]|nr:Nif11-like leader peptide family natural product precursor [Lentisphaeria bacterium]